MAEQTEPNLDPETMPLDQLRAMIPGEPLPEVPKVPEPEVTVEAAAEVEVPKEEIEKEPEQFVIKSEIDLGDGSGVQVFTGTGTTKMEALEDLSKKQENAIRHNTLKIRELSSRVKKEDAHTEQQKIDDDYIISQRLQKEPSKAIRDVVSEVIAEREAVAARALEVQRIFVDSHPDYVADQDNAQRITSEFRRLNPEEQEFTEQGLEKAYQSLKASGLLKVKVEEAGGTTEVDTPETERLVQPRVEATQPRSPKRSSTVSTRSSSPAFTKSGPTEDELMTMPLEQLRKLADQQEQRARGDVS